MDLVSTPGNTLNALQGLSRLSAVRQVGLLLALAGSVALGVLVVLWSQAPSYTLLHASLSGKEATEVLDALEEAGIPYRLEQSSGAVMVPSAKVHDARLKLAAHGLPKSTDLGFEVLDRNSSFGTSQFLEQARYQRALEVELARSVSTLNSIQSARVHLAVPKQSVFVRNRKKPSASVLVRLYPGRKLEDGQGETIAHLVAAAIPALEPSEVRVIDQRGRLLTSPQGVDHLALSHKEFEYSQRVEEVYTKRIESILAPVVGVESVKAQVTAVLDFTRTEQTQETYDSDPTVLRSEQVLEERADSPIVGGVPGALSNQPPGEASVLTDASVETAIHASSGNRGGLRRESTRNFEVDRTINHTRMPSGTVQRLSAAVVVDDRRSVDAQGGQTLGARTEEEMARITSLVKDAIGFDAERGDSVHVINTSFTMPAPVGPLPQPSLWERPWVWDALKQLAGVTFVLLLLFAVLRPIMRQLVTQAPENRQLEQSTDAARLDAAGDAGSDDEKVTLTDQRRQNTPSLQAQAAQTANIDAIRTLVAEDPKRVAKLVRNWVTDGD